MKLGRKAVKTDSRTLRVGQYMKTLPPVPRTRDWIGNLTNWGMMLNDSLGDCTCAACGHAIQVWTRNVGFEYTVPDNSIKDAYEKWCGYNPADSSTDNGGVELDVLNAFKNQGLGGHKLDVFAAVNFANLEEIKQAINLFGGVYIGLNLPTSAQQQTAWSYVPGTKDNAPGSWGGHAVFVPKYSEAGFTCITWGAPMWMSNYFWTMYCDEAYALVSTDFLNLRGDTPAGFDLQQLLADLALIR